MLRDDVIASLVDVTEAISCLVDDACPDILKRDEWNAVLDAKGYDEAASLFLNDDQSFDDDSGDSNIFRFAVDFNERIELLLSSMPSFVSIKLVCDPKTLDVNFSLALTLPGDEGLREHKSSDINIESDPDISAIDIKNALNFALHDGLQSVVEKDYRHVADKIRQEIALRRA